MYHNCCDEFYNIVHIARITKNEGEVDRYYFITSATADMRQVRIKFCPLCGERLSFARADVQEFEEYFKCAFDIKKVEARKQ